MKNMYFKFKPLFVFGCVAFSLVAKGEPEPSNKFYPRIKHAVAYAKKQVAGGSAAVKSFAQKKQHAFISSVGGLRDSVYSSCSQLATNNKLRMNRIKRKAINGIISINGRYALAQDIFMDYVEEHPYQAGIAATIAVIAGYKICKRNNKE